jgi:hypothetical protein
MLLAIVLIVIYPFWAHHKVAGWQVTIMALILFSPVPSGAGVCWWIHLASQDQMRKQTAKYDEVVDLVGQSATTTTARAKEMLHKKLAREGDSE